MYFAHYEGCEFWWKQSYTIGGSSDLCLVGAILSPILSGLFLGCELQLSGGVGEGYVSERCSGCQQLCWLCEFVPIILIAIC